MILDLHTVFIIITLIVVLMALGYVNYKYRTKMANRLIEIYKGESGYEDKQVSFFKELGE